MKRIPTRTLVLMVLTLVAFGWMYWQTHSRPPPRREAPRDVPIITVPLDAGRAAIEQAIREALDGSLIQDNAPSAGAVVQADAGSR